MCSTEMQTIEAKEYESNMESGFSINHGSSSNLLDLNQNQRNHKVPQMDSLSPVHSSSSSSVSSISPAGAGASQMPSQSTSLVPDVTNPHSNNEYEKPPGPLFPFPVNNSNSISPMDHYRLQFYNYAMVERLRNSNGSNLQHLYQPVAAYGSRLALSMSLFHNRVFQPEEPKPQHSYIGLIAMAILSTPDQKLVLSDIYQHILDNYPYFRSRGPGWRNSIRHNLSLNDCFIKSGRSANGKGHYWAIHPANIEDFKKGDFRRRKAQRKVRKHMGLAVDEDGTDSPSPPPLALTPPPHGLPFPAQAFNFRFGSDHHWNPVVPLAAASLYTHSSRKRQFDVASLLAPDNDDQPNHNNHQIELTHSPVAKRLHLMANHDQEDEDIDVVANDDTASIIENDSITRRSNIEHKLPIEENFYASQRPAWSSLMQHLPLGINSMDPRVIGRCYGQYMVHNAANKRLFNSLNFNPTLVNSSHVASKSDEKRDVE